MVEERAQLLDLVIEIIADLADPEQIILFESRATGAAAPKSDDDLLVVVPHADSERHISHRIYCALLDQGVGILVYIVVVSRETLERHRDTPGMVCRRALAEGEVIYRSRR